MPNDAIVTVRIPAALKRRLELRARRGHRSLSAQVLHDLEQAARGDVPARPGRFVGLYAGTPVASDADIRQVRTSLWGRRLVGRDTALAGSGLVRVVWD